jgi:hypothetical protein
MRGFLGLFLAAGGYAVALRQHLLIPDEEVFLQDCLLQFLAFVLLLEVPLAGDHAGEALLHVDDFRMAKGKIFGVGTCECELAGGCACEMKGDVGMLVLFVFDWVDDGKRCFLEYQFVSSNLLQPSLLAPQLLLALKHRRSLE